MRGKDGWNELELQSRQGLSRVHYFYWCNVEDILQLVTHQKQVLGQRTFIFPHFLQAHTVHDALLEVNKHDEMLIDLRKEMDMSDLKNNVTRNSLTSEFTVIR